MDEFSLARAVKHVAQTTRLLGVDFLPVSISPAPGHPHAGGGNGGRHAPPEGEPAPAPGPHAPAPHAVVEVKEQNAKHSRPAGVGAAMFSSKAHALAELRREHDQNCPHCTRATGHTQTVFGDGDPDAALMFIGEAPGAEEDKLGIPFVGASGKKLNEMIVAMGLSRERVYIANILKARPPNNDTPTPEEAARCGPYLLRQIEIIQPKVIVTLGKPAISFMLKTSESMSSLRGVWSEFHGIPLMPTYHPAYLLRAYTTENRMKVWSDLKQAKAKLDELLAGAR